MNKIAVGIQNNTATHTAIVVDLHWQQQQVEHELETFDAFLEEELSTLVETFWVVDLAAPFCFQESLAQERHCVTDLSAIL